MSQMHTCLACGYTGHDVRMTLVEIPLDEQRVVPAAIVANEDRRGPRGFEYREVRERYVYEPRCPDWNARPGQPSACRERRLAAEAEYSAAQPVQPSVEPPTDGDDAWLS